MSISKQHVKLCMWLCFMLPNMTTCFSLTCHYEDHTSRLDNLNVTCTHSFSIYWSKHPQMLNVSLITCETYIFIIHECRKTSSFYHLCQPFWSVKMDYRISNMCRPVSKNIRFFLHSWDELKMTLCEV